MKFILDGILVAFIKRERKTLAVGWKLMSKLMSQLLSFLPKMNNYSHNFPGIVSIELAHKLPRLEILKQLIAVEVYYCLNHNYASMRLKTRQR